MKRTALIFLLTGLSLGALAQRQFSDGQITYQVSVDLPPGTPAQAADMFKDSRLVYSFKSYLFRYDMTIGKNTYTNIRDSRAHTAVSLIDDGGGNRYLIRFDTAQLAQESARFRGMRFKDGTGTRKIAGYNCKEATGTLPDGSTFKLYYTPDLLPEDNDYNARFAGLKGLPLAFETTTRSHVKMTMTAISVNLAPQPRANFETPTGGYREISYKELQELRKNQ